MLRYTRVIHSWPWWKLGVIHFSVELSLCVCIVFRPEFLRQLQALSQRSNVQKQWTGQLHVPLPAGLRWYQLWNDHPRLYTSTLPEWRHLPGIVSCSPDDDLNYLPRKAKTVLCFASFDFRQKDYLEKIWNIFFWNYSHLVVCWA